MPPDDFRVDGMRVLVTGSSRGLGAGVAAYLAAHGAAVVLHGRDEERLAKVRSGIEGTGGRAAVVRGDARDAEAVTAFVEEAAQAFGGLDALVNNAGGAFTAPAEALSPNGFASVVAANLTAPFVVAQAALPHLERSRGSIVNIASVAGLHATPNHAHYGAAKAGLMNLTQTLAAEWSPRGVRVNAVAPGIMATEAAMESVYSNDPERVTQAARRCGMGRLGTAEDLAMACRYLISPAAAFVNGAVLVLDGGPPPTLPY